MPRKNYAVTVPTGGPQYPSTPNDWVAFPFVLVATAKRNSGKTCALTSFLKILHNMNRLDRLILVSPTYGNNTHYFHGLPLHPEDVIEPSINAAQEVIDKVEEEAYLYEDYYERTEKWKHMQKMLRSKKNILEFVDDEMLTAFGPDLEKPSHKWGGRKPIIIAMFDDIQGTQVFSTRSKINYLTIKHRHIGETRHNSVGVNLMFAVQSYTSTGGTGLPRTIRSQITQLIVFKTKSQKELDLIQEEAAGEVDRNTFFRLYEEATKAPYSFMTIDFAKKESHPSMFRKCFSEFLE